MTRTISFIGAHFALQRR